MSIGLTNQVPTLTTPIADFIIAGGYGSERARMTVTFNNTVGTVPLFTVTGDVALRLAAICKVNVASAAGCNGQVGIAGALDAIIPNTDMTLLTANEIWYDAAPDAEIESFVLIGDRLISHGNDVILTLSAQADSGQVDFFCFWTPISADGNVVPA